MIEQLEYGTGTSDYLGQMWTWVSGESAVDPVTIVGVWSNVIQCHSANQRIECLSANKRLET